MGALHDSVSDRQPSKMFSACRNNTATSSAQTPPSIIILRLNSVIKGTVFEAYLTLVAVPI